MSKHEKKNVPRIRKKTFYLQFCMERMRRSLQAQPKIIKKINGSTNQNDYVLFFKNKRKSKICTGATRRSLKAQPLSSKMIKTPSYIITTKNFPKKKYVYYLKK
jgi:hypothetical protein